MCEYWDATDHYKSEEQDIPGAEPAKPSELCLKVILKQGEVKMFYTNKHITFAVMVLEVFLWKIIKCYCDEI